MKLVVAALVAGLSACGGGKRTAPNQPPEPAPIATAPEPVATAPVAEETETRESFIEQAIADLRVLATEMCACPDTTCLDNVTAKMEALAQKYTHVESERVPQAAMDEVETIARQMANCAARITTGRRTRPKLPGQP